jgi:hypothetical protein
MREHDTWAGDPDMTFCARHQVDVLLDGLDMPIGTSVPLAPFPGVVDVLHAGVGRAAREGKGSARSQLGGLGVGLAGLRRRRIRNPGSLLSFS